MPGEKLAHEDEGCSYESPQFVVSWGGGHEDHYELDCPSKHLDLVQQICRDALDHLNHELFDLELAREVRITLADLDTVLNDDFFRRGTVYFDGVWTQASDRDQRTLLRAMAQRGEPWTFAELEAATGLDADTLRRQLRWAERHDMLHRTESDGWEFCVPLMRRWIRKMG